MNLKNFTRKSFWEHFSSWKRVSLFEKSFFVSALITCAAFLVVTLPATRPDPSDLSNEFSPQFLESAFMTWIMPLGLFGMLLMRIGLYPGNDEAGLWGGVWTLAFANTFFWAFVFWIFARIMKLLRSKIVSLRWPVERSRK